MNTTHVATPGPLGTGGRITQTLVALQTQVSHNKSMRGTGVLTTVTTRGVIQKVNRARLRAVVKETPASTIGTVRWG